MSKIVKYNPQQLTVLDKVRSLVVTIAQEPQSPPPARRGKLPCYSQTDLRGRLRSKLRTCGVWVDVLSGEADIMFKMPGYDTSVVDSDTCVIKDMRAEMDRILEVFHEDGSFVYTPAPEGCVPGTEYLHAKYKLETLTALYEQFIALYAALVEQYLVDQK